MKSKTITEIKQEKRFIIWKDFNGSKRPMAPRGETGLKSRPDGGKFTERDSFTYRKARIIAKKHRADGVGILLGDGLCGCDLDGIGNNITSLDEVAKDHPFIKEDFGHGYIEVSPSGNGIHILYYGNKPGNACKGRINGHVYELYDGDRYFTLTENTLNGNVVRSADATNFYNGYIDTSTKKPKQEKEEYDENAGWDGTDKEFVEFMERNRLTPYGMVWEGDDYTFEYKYNSDHSAMDQALINHLTFFLGPNPERIEHFARMSGWYLKGDVRKDKWDDRSDYLKRTIKTAIKDHEGKYFGIERDGEKLQPHHPQSEMAYGPLLELKTELPQLMQDIYQHIMSLSRYEQPAFAFFTMFFLFGATLGRYVMLEDIAPNLYIKFLGSTGCGKDKMLKYVKHYMEEIGIHYKRKVKSAAGAEDEIFKNDTEGTLIYLADENRPLSSDQAVELSDFESEIYSAHGGTFHPRVLSDRSQNKNAPSPIRYPFYAKLAATTVEAQFNEISWTQMISGEGARTIYVITDIKRPIYKDIEESIIMLPQFEDWSVESAPERMHFDGVEFEPRRLSLSPEARQWFTTAQQDLDRKLGNPALHPITHALGTRIGEYSKRFALIITLADNPKAKVVPKRWMELSFKIMLTYVRITSELVKPNVSKSRGGADAVEALRRMNELLKHKEATMKSKMFKDYSELVQQGYIPRRILMQALNETGESMEMIERTLIERGEIQADKVEYMAKKRKSKIKVWYLIKS